MVSLNFTHYADKGISDHFSMTVVAVMTMTARYMLTKHITYEMMLMMIKK